MKISLLVSLMIVSNSLIAGVYNDPGGFIYPEYTSKKFLIKKDIEIGLGEQAITISNGECKLTFGNRNCYNFNPSNKDCLESDTYKAGTILTIFDGSNDAHYGNWDNHDGSLDVQSYIDFGEKNLAENKSIFQVAGLMCKGKVYGIHGALLSMAFHKEPLTELRRFKNVIEEISN